MMLLEEVYLDFVVEQGKVRSSARDGGMQCGASSVKVISAREKEKRA